MIRADITKELEILRQRVAELEELQDRRQQTEETFIPRATEEWYRAILESSEEGLLVFNRKGRIIDANQKVEEITGYKRKDLCGKTTLSVARLLTHKGLTVFWKNPLNRTVRSSKQPYEIDVFKKNGELVTAQIKCKPLKADNKETGRLVMLKDVTAVRRAERESGNSQEVYKSLVNHVAVGVFRISPGGSGRFLEVNPAMAVITGYSREELLQMNVADLYLHPEERIEQVREVLSGIPATAREFHFKKKDGTEIIVRDSKIAARGSDGKTLYLEGFLEDITEHKLAEEALKASEQNFRNSIDSSSVGIRIADKDDHTLYLNPAFLKIFGYENGDEAEISPPLKHYTPESYADYLLRGEKKLRGEPRQDAVEVDIIHKNGTVRHLRLSTRELFWNGKQQFQTLYEDITDRKRTENLIAENERKYRSLFISMIEGAALHEIIYSSEGKPVNYRILEVNPAFAKQTGINVENACGRLATEVYQTASPPYFELYEKVARTGEPCLFETYFEPLDRCFSISVYCPKPGWFVTVFTNITERKKMEKELTESEQNFRNSLHSSMMGIRIMGDADYTIYANQALLDMFGYQNIEELRASPPHEHYTAETYAGFVRRHEQFVRGETLPDELEISIIRKDGAIRHLRLTSRDVVWNGKPQHQFIYNDITERTQIEAALKRSEQNFRNSLDTSPTGIRISDKNDCTSYANQALLDIFGYADIAEVKSNPPQEHYTPDCYADWVLRHEKLLRGEPMPAHVEIDIKHKDGTIRHLDVSMRDVFWDDKTQYQTLYNDITELKNAEIKIADSERQYRLVTENMTDVIWKIDADNPTRFNFISPSVAHLLGYTAEEAMNLAPGEIFPLSSIKDAMNFLLNNRDRVTKEHVDDHHSITLELELKHQNDTTIVAEVNYTLIQKDNQRSYELLAVARDITDRRQAEAQLRHSETKYSTLVEKGNDGVLVIQDGLLRFANSKVVNIIGLPLEKTIGRSFLDFIPPQYRTFVADNYKKRMIGEEAVNRYEIEILAQNNTSIPVEISASIIEYEGKPADMAFIRDITERKQAENQVKESEDNLRAYLENAPDGIYMCDLKGCLLYGNKKAEEILGYKKEELIGRNFLTLNLLPTKYLPKAGKLMALNALGRNTGPDELELVRKDGSLNWVEINTAPIKQKDQKLIIGFVREIAERKGTEEKLEQAAQEWRTTFDSITDLISIHDKDNRIIRVNRALAELLHTTPQELIGKYCHEVMHGTKEPPESCTHCRTFANSKPISIEAFNAKLGLHLQESASPIFDDKGQVTGSVVVARDVTQQKRMEEQLVMTDRLASIGELSSGIAHELNNPLTSVIGFSQLLMEGDVPENIKEDLGIVHSEAQRAATIVKNLLTFARKHAPVKQLSNVNTVIEDVLRLRAYEQKVNNIEIENRLSPNLPEIMIDHFQMQQVFLNIMVNAEFAMQEAHHKGKLVVSTEKLAGTIRISFADDGPGISKENLKHIFDPFFTTKEVGKGTGLGLSICHGIVTEHGGQIYATSEKGQGATFIVELPLINEQQN